MSGVLLLLAHFCIWPFMLSATHIHTHVNVCKAHIYQTLLGRFIAKEREKKLFFCVVSSSTSYFCFLFSCSFSSIASSIILCWFARAVRFFIIIVVATHMVYIDIGTCVCVRCTCVYIHEYVCLLLLLLPVSSCFFCICSNSIFFF